MASVPGAEAIFFRREREYADCYSGAAAGHRFTAWQGYLSLADAGLAQEETDDRDADCAGSSVAAGKCHADDDEAVSSRLTING